MKHPLWAKVFLGIMIIFVLVLFTKVAHWTPWRDMCLALSGGYK